MFIARLAMSLGTALLLLGCDSARPPVGPTAVAGAVSNQNTAVVATAQAAAASAVAVADVSGSWNWSEEVVLALPEWLGPVFGFVPEGPVTHMRCQDFGVMNISQAGTSFSGTATQTSTCQTRGGQVFSPAVFPSSIQISDGRIDGRSIHLFFGPSPNEVPAPYDGTISEIVGGVATALRGTGRAIPPGHPQSPLFVDPPAPPSKTISWQASRP